MPTTPDRIANALIASGYTTLDAQASALGIHRSTAWHIIKSKHKIGRLSEKVRQKMLANLDLPLLVRQELELNAISSGENGRSSAEAVIRRSVFARSRD